MREALVAIDRPSELVLVRVASTPTRAFHFAELPIAGSLLRKKIHFSSFGKI